MTDNEQARLSYLSSRYAAAQADADAMVHEADEWRRTIICNRSAASCRRMRDALDAHAITLAQVAAKALHELNTARAFHEMSPMAEVGVNP